MKAVTAFDLLLKCAIARRGDGQTEKNAALDAVIATLGAEIRRILTPDDEEKTS